MRKKISNAQKVFLEEVKKWCRENRAKSQRPILEEQNKSVEKFKRRRMEEEDDQKDSRSWKLCIGKKFFRKKVKKERLEECEEQRKQDNSKRIWDTTTGTKIRPKIFLKF